MRSRGQIEKSLELYKAAFVASIEALAVQVREQYVIPACRKYGVEYLAGNGTHAFFTDDGTIADDIDCRRERKMGLLPVLEILKLEVDHVSCLGDFVVDVKKDDLKALDNR